MPEMPEAFKLDSGLREDMVLSVHSAYFAPSADYMDGKVLMLWLIGTDENEDPVEVRLSAGADWQTDDGNVITHPTKKKQHINKNSIYGHWLSSSFEIPELARLLIDRSDSLGGKGACDSRIWLDLILHLQNKTLHFGKNIDDQERLMPVEYMGLTEETSAVTVPAPSVSPRDPGDIDPQAMLAAARAKATNGSTLRDRAIGLAKEAQDFPTFLAKAFADNDILADEELAEQCADKSQIYDSVH
jgi:hypothetical protein